MTAFARSFLKLPDSVLANFGCDDRSGARVVKTETSDLNLVSVYCGAAHATDVNNAKIMTAF